MSAQNRYVRPEFHGASCWTIVNQSSRILLQLIKQILLLYLMLLINSRRLREENLCLHGLDLHLAQLRILPVGCLPFGFLIDSCNNILLRSRRLPKLLPILLDGELHTICG